MHQALQGDVDQTMSDELRTVCTGFAYKVLAYEKYDVNGYRFRTRNHEESRPGRRTTNTGLMSVCAGIEYYGILEKIYEVKWNNGSKRPKAVIFKCHWFDPSHYRRDDRVGLVEIKRDKTFVCEDVYIVAQQVTQVYYLSYPCKKAKNLQDYDVVYKVSPYGKAPIPIDEDYHPLINPNTYEGEIFQEERGLTGHFVIDLTGAQGMEVEYDGDGDDVEEEVEDLEDLSYLEGLSLQNDGPDDPDAHVDDTRDSDSDDEVDGPDNDTRAYDYPDPDDPDYDQYMYASQSLFIYYMHVLYLIYF